MSESKGKPSLDGFSDVDAAGETAHFVSYLDQAAIVLRSFRRAGDHLLGLCGGERLLDVGCGTGDATGELAALVQPGGLAVGVDSSEAMVAEACKRTAGSSVPVQFQIAKAQELPFPDNYFHACNAERLFVHLSDPARVLAEIVRVLKPGGRIVVREADLDMI